MGALRAILLYGAVTGAVLFSLYLIRLSPLVFDWGRELVGATIAVVAILVGLKLAHRPDSGAGPSDAPASAPGPAPMQVEAATSLPQPPAAATTTTQLSPREFEMVRLLAQGLSNKAIARQSNLSENTVKTHLANVYAKLAVGGRVEAIAAARRLGLLDG